MARDRWTSRTVFLFAAIGSAVGLGNVWRFPYLTYKFGGGAFLVPYLIALFVIGIPLLIMEFAIGQKLQKGALESFGMIHQRLKGVGFIAIISGFIVVIYYAVVMAWSIVFLLRSFTFNLPWAEDAKGYFFNNVLHISSSVGEIGGINHGIILALLATWVIIYFIVFKGTKSVGKVVMITMPLPAILLIVLFFRGIMLEGALTGIYYYLKPNFTALLDPEIWLAAVSQIFFTLSLAFGIMIAYASYNNKKEVVTKNAYITALTNSGISIFAGFVVFAILGYMATSTGVSVPDVITSGPGLAFVVFPQALSMMPFASIFSVIFFIMLFSLGIDSAFSLVEAMNTVVKDKFSKLSREKISFWVCTVAFVLGIIFTTNAGLYFLDIVDHFVTSFTLILAGLFEAIVVGWVLGAKNLRNYINSVSEWKLGIWWDVSIKYVVPIMLIILLVVQFMTELKTPYEGYPGWALAIGWAAVVVPILIAFGMLFPKKTDA